MKKALFACCLSLSCALSAYTLNHRTMSVERLSNGDSYFEISVQDSGVLQGNYSGWCADLATRIEDGKSYSAKFYSSYDQDLPEGLVNRPENLDEMNWLINQYPVGESSPGGFGEYTSGDVQLAIWTLLDDSFDTTTVGPYSQERVDELVAMALSQGSGFYPSCKQIVGIILDPKDPETGSKVQSTIVEVPRNHFPKCVIPEDDEHTK